MKNKSDNIVKYQKKRRKRTINISIVFFAVIFIYLIIMLIKSFTQETLSVYEVNKGKISDKTQYSGIILRDEAVYYASNSGYVNYYVREKSKVAVNNLIYTIDKDGEFKKQLDNSIQEGNVSLSSDALKGLKVTISDYMMDFSSNNFDNVYDINSNIMLKLHSYIEDAALSSDISSLSISNILSESYSDVSGIVAYYVDGYEDLKINNITSKQFSKKNYDKTCLTNGREIALWEPVYKLIKSDDWSVIFIPDENEIETFKNIDAVNVNFKYNNLTAEARVSLFNGADGNIYAELDFDKYMTEFLSDRFIDFEICYNEIEGLKIPKSSVVTKDVLKIPVQYAAYGGSGQTKGFLKEVVSGEGTSIEFVTGTIYKEDDFYYYVDCKELSIGDIIVKEGISNERYEVCLSETLNGVYSVNKGYAVFKRISILGEQEDYYIIKEGIKKGVSKNDHIALIGDKISEGQIIY